jgi:tetratricopeptide (TPR) repeat protein
VNTGEVVAGDPSSGQRLVTGDTVNVAARLEQAAGEREVLLGELTYKLVRDAVEVEPVEPLELKGKSEPVPAYRLVSVAETGEGWTRRRDAPMVGREAELELLVSKFHEAVATRSPRLVTVIGDAGVGKSRLNDEFLHTVSRGARVLRGRCLSYGDGITFWPLVEAVRQAASIREDDPPETALLKLSALAGERNADVVDRVAAAIGLGAHQFSLEELFWGTRKLFELLARESPLVVLFDDIHWAEPTFLELIEHLLDSTAEAPLLLLCPARHDLLERNPEWAERARAARMVLQPLTSADMEAVVGNLLGEAGISNEARARIVASADGNPLFVEQMLSMLIDNGLLRFEDGRWIAASDLADLAVPPTIQALLAARLDSLTDAERAVIEPASVIGHVFAEAAVEALVADAARPSVHGHLSNLSRKQLVRLDLSAIDEERFRFSHVLIREAAYNGLLKRARATFHEHFVEWADVVNRERGRETEYEEILGYHLEQAYRYLSELGPIDEHGRELGRDGSRRLASAGRRAFARADMAAAARLLERAASLLEERDRQRLALLPDLSEALLDTGRFADAGAVAAEAAAAARDSSDSRLEAHAALAHLLLGRYAGEPSWGARVAEETTKIIPALEHAKDYAGLAKAWRLVCLARMNECRFADFLAAAEKDLEYATLAGDRRGQMRAVTGTALAAAFGPTPVDEAIPRCEEVLAQVAGENRRSHGAVAALLARLYAMRGDVERARVLCDESRAVFEDGGSHVASLARALDAGLVALSADDLDLAERELRRGYDALAAIGETYYTSTIAAILAEVLYEAGRLDEANEFTRVAEEVTSDDDAATQAEWLSVRAKVLARSGQHEQAFALAGEAVQLLSETDALVWQADAIRDEAEVLWLAGRETRAQERFAEAIRRYEAKGDIASARRARARLAQLTEQETPVSASR